MRAQNSGLHLASDGEFSARMRKLLKRMLIPPTRMEMEGALSALAHHLRKKCCGLAFRATPVRNAHAGRRDAILSGCRHCYSSARSYRLRIHDLN